MILGVTGHRPDKLGGYSAKANSALVQTAIHSLRHLNPAKVITGMALGWDQSIAQAAIALRIPFIAAVPFKGQEAIWPRASQRIYKALLGAAEEVVIVSEGGYDPRKMQVRNQWIVDHSDRILALWDGSFGGTFNCVNYARSQGVPISNAWKHFEQNGLHRSIPDQDPANSADIEDFEAFDPHP